MTTGQNRLALRLHETDVVHGFVARGAGHVDLVVLREAVGEVGSLFMCSIIIDIWLIWAINIVNLCGDNNLLGLVTGWKAKLQSIYRRDNLLHGDLPTREIAAIYHEYAQMLHSAGIFTHLYRLKSPNLGKDFMEHMGCEESRTYLNISLWIQPFRGSMTGVWFGRVFSQEVFWIHRLYIYIYIYSFIYLFMHLLYNYSYIYIYT